MRDETGERASKGQVQLKEILCTVREALAPAAHETLACVPHEISTLLKEKHFESFLQTSRKMKEVGTQQ